MVVLLIMVEFFLIVMVLFVFFCLENSGFVLLVWLLFCSGLVSKLVLLVISLMCGVLGLSVLIVSVKWVDLLFLFLMLVVMVVK